jgi:hypothetical protein
MSSSRRALRTFSLLLKLSWTSDVSGKNEDESLTKAEKKIHRGYKCNCKLVHIGAKLVCGNDSIERWNLASRAGFSRDDFRCSFG